MKKLMGWTPLACFLVVLGGVLVVVACDNASGPTAPPPPADNVASVPGTANLQAGGPGGTPEGGREPGGFGSQPWPVQEATGSGQPKTDVCHLEGNGTFIIISVADPAIQSHIDHGDHFIQTFYLDGDGDGFGTQRETGCVLPPGYVWRGNDCNDANPDAYPGATEVCDGVDNNCDGEVDEDYVCFTCPCEDDYPIASLGWPGYSSYYNVCWVRDGYLPDTRLWERRPPHPSATVSLYPWGSGEPLICAWVIESEVVSLHTGLSYGEMFVCDEVIRAQAARLGAPCVNPY